MSILRREYPYVDMEEQISRLNDRVKTYLAPSKIHGVGVFALRDIAKGQSLYADAVPEVYSVRWANWGKLFPEVGGYLLSQWPDVINGSNFIHPTTRVLGHMNHNDKPNYDAYGDKTLVDIKKGEEITENYRLIKGYAQVYPFLS